MQVHKAVVLAAGVGSRMQASACDARLTPQQRRAADDGLKGLMPFEQPFLDYVIATLAQAGIAEVCLVVGPRSRALRDYAENAVGGPRVTTAIQRRPRGTADALLAAREFTAGGPFLVLNSDTYYPLPALESLASLDGWGLLVVERDATARDPTTHLSADRLASFAVVTTSGSGDALEVAGLEEKPGRERLDALPAPVYLSVNGWRFDAAIHDYCAGLTPSSRGEYELPSAALAAVEAGVVIRLVPATGVLDLSTRDDVAEVARLLPPSSSLEARHGA